MGVISKLKKRKLYNELDSTKPHSSGKVESSVVDKYVKEFNEGFNDMYVKAIACDTDDEMFIVFAKALKGMKDYVKSEGIRKEELKSILKKSNFIDVVIKLCVEKKRQ